MSNRNNSQNLKQPNLVEWLNHPSEKFAHVKLDKIPQVGVKIEIFETATWGETYPFFHESMI